MTTQQAITYITSALSRMRHAFSKPVFDEWVIFRLEQPIPDIVHYNGPRAEEFEPAFKRDTKLLMKELRQEHYATGHFYFARDAEGDLYDAFLVLGPSTYAVFNNTDATMSDITRDPLWADAQIHFVELSERFVTSPLR
jgi:hypothetical protein